MAEQLVIGSGPEVSARDLTLTEQWELFVAEHPDVPGELRRITLALVADSGGRPVGMPAVWEEARRRRLTSGEPIRMDNSLRAPAARWMQDRYRDLRGLYRTRRSKADTR